MARLLLVRTQRSKKRVTPSVQFFFSCANFFGVARNFLHFFVQLDEKRPIGRFLLALAEGPSARLVKNVLPDERGVKGVPFGPISKKRIAGRTGFLTML